MFDLIIRGARIVDGTGRPSHVGSVAIAGDRISEVSPDPNPDWGGTVAIDARGAALSPGFVDVHNHSDLSMFVDPWMRSALLQGVTTVIVGNCGSSAWPPAGAPELASMVGAPELEVTWRTFGEYLDAVARCRPAVNVASLVGHGAIRQEVMGSSRDDPDGPGVDAMRRLAGDAIDEGAVGVSSGLIYVPGIYSRTEEVAAVASASASRRRIYASHIRGEGKMLFDALAEAAEIGDRAGVSVHVSHLKCETSHVWGQASRVLSFVHGSHDMTADQYPYVAWNSSFASLLPPWAPVEELAEIWRSSSRERLVQAVEHGEPEFQSSVDGVGWDSIFAVTGVPEGEAGCSVADIAAGRNVSPIEALVQILLEDPEASCIGHAMSEDDVREILADREVMVASDASAMSPDGPLGSAPVHPREYGTFPRVLGRYVREGVLDLETAVRKMTSLPASRFGLEDRGVIEERAIADLVLFEPGSIDDAATFEHPQTFPEGIRAVVVAGKVVWDGSDVERAGRVLRG